MIDGLVEQLKRDEGLRLTPYKDSVGKLTIGIGRNLDDVGISVDEAEYMLNNDIQRAASDLLKALPWTEHLDRVRNAVLVNMAFNMGIRGLLQFKNTLSLIQQGKYDYAAEAMLQSRWASQVGIGTEDNPGRARRLARQMQTGEWQ